MGTYVLAAECVQCNLTYGIVFTSVTAYISSAIIVSFANSSFNFSFSVMYDYYPDRLRMSVVFVISVAIHPTTMITSSNAVAVVTTLVIFVVVIGMAFSCISQFSIYICI